MYAEKLTGSGSQKSVGKVTEASRIESFSDRDEEMRRYGHICSDVLVDQGLVFQLHPLRRSEWPSGCC